MAHHRPWYKRSGGAFLMATLGFPDAETKWAYSAIIDMLNDRDRPLTDDAGFICGFTGLTRKKWAIVRRYLLETESGSGNPFLVLTDRGDLTNPRFERERAERHRMIDEAVEHGRAGGRKSAAMRAAGQAELDLPDRDPPRARALGADAKVGPKSPRKSAESTPNGRGNGAAKVEPAARNSNDLGQDPPQPIRARKSLEERKKDSTHPDSENDPRATPDRLNDHDLKDLVDAVCDASGYRPISPGQIDRAYRVVQEWRTEGFDFNVVVVPTIKAVVAESSDPTRTLGRFTARIRHEHARLKAKGEAGRSYSAPASPVLEVEGEDEAMRAIRADLLKSIGPVAYCLAANRARFEAVDDAMHGRPLRVIEPGNGNRPLLDGVHAGTLRFIAKRHGFTEVW